MHAELAATMIAHGEEMVQLNKIKRLKNTLLNGSKQIWGENEAFNQEAMLQISRNNALEGKLPLTRKQFASKEEQQI